MTRRRAVLLLLLAGMGGSLAAAELHKEKKGYWWKAEPPPVAAPESEEPYQPLTAPPDYASPPILWGREDHVRDLFAGVATAFEFERHTNWIESESIESWADFFMTRFGPLVTARAALGDRFGELRERTVQIWRDANQGEGGRMRVPQEYLVSIIRL